MTHVFRCETMGCDGVVNDTNTHGVHHCPNCGGEMYWDLHNIGIRPGDYHHVSDSLAIHPDDAVEHRKMFPGVEVTSEGQLGFTSPKQQEKYANRCGFDKKRQRSKQLGRKRIA